jgi:hypothetical protein
MENYVKGCWMITIRFKRFCSLAQNRTGISGSGDLRTIHCTTRPKNSGQNYIKKFRDN